LEEAVLRFCGHNAVVFAAGRTDAGVHALGQVAHLDLPEEYSAEVVQRAVNFHLKPAPVVILASETVDDTFHARFSARKRAYTYRILNRPAPAILNLHRAWHVKPPLHVEKMQAAALMLVGHHDFSSFRTVACQAKSPVKTLDNIIVERQGDEIVFHVSAQSFLHHMVRNLVGTLKLVGMGKWEPEDVRIALEAKDRKAAGPTAPAHGLYLTKVEY
jgi:tRNA pseudouridine38-40 synthase